MVDQVTIAGSRGSVLASVGDTFRDPTSGGDWKIERFDTGDRLYSPTGLGGTFTVRCRPLSELTSYWIQFLEEDGTVLWCADSVASALLAPSPQTRAQP